jgi:hypothetical protein
MMGLLESLKIDLSKEIPNPKMVIYGPPGSRKTSFAGEADDPVWLDWERSADTISVLIRKGHLPSTIGCFRPKTLAQAKDLTAEIIKSGRYKTLVIDTVTRMQKKQMREYIAHHPSVTGKRVQTLPGSGTITRDENTTWQSDFNYSTTFIDNFLMDLMDAPIGVIMIAHDKEKQRASESQNGIVTYTLEKIEPNLTPKLQESMTELFSLVGYMTVKSSAVGGNTEHRLRVNASNIIVAKNRLDIREPEIINPKYKEIFK